NAGCQFTLALKLFVNLEVSPTGVVLRRGNSRVGKILKRRLKPLSAFGVGGPGDHGRNRVASSFAQNAIGLTCRITINLAAPGSMALPGDAGQLQGASICRGDMAVHAVHKDGMVSCDFVNIPARGRGFYRPKRFVPATAHNP